MANSNRLTKSYLAEASKNADLLHSEGFMPLLRYLEANAPLASRLGYSVSPKYDFARFGQKPLLHFYPAAFCDINFSEKLGEYKIKNSYFGFLGINGPLPTHLTEYAIERKVRFKDRTFCEFLDIFNHRFISLFYRAWSDAEPAVNHDKPKQDNFVKLLKSFSGEVDNPTDDKPSFVHQYLSGLLSHKNRSGHVLTQILAEYLKLPVSIRQLQGKWLDIPKSEQTTLGKANALLGQQTIAGTKTFQRMFNFCVQIGPVSYQQYLALLKDNKQMTTITQLIKKFVGPEFEFSIQFYLDKQQTKAATLGMAKLGLTSWCQSETSHLQQNEPILVYTKEC